MARLNQRELPADLVRAQERLAEWRRTKTPRSRIPESLWKMAVDLAAKHQLHRTARALNLDYYSLKKRVESNSALGAAVRYLLKHWEKLTLFLRKAGAPLTTTFANGR